jgi:hypothetical protein
LFDLVTKGKRAAAVLTRARILLKADAGLAGPAWTDEAIAEAVETSPSTVHRVRLRLMTRLLLLGCVETSPSTVHRVRQRFVEEGLQAALHRKKPEGRQYRKLDGAQEARLIALACSTPP